MSDSSLRNIQHWMETVVTTRGDLREKLQKAAGALHLDIQDLVESKRGVSAHRRLDIYASGYVLRLLECLKSDYPGLLAFMGEEAFEAFAKAYIVSLPPQSWSLFYLGQRFPQFLRDTQPASATPDALMELPAEIAALERLKTEVHYVPGTEEQVGETDTVATGTLDYFFDGTRVQTASCLRLVELKYPLTDFLHRLEQGEMPPLPDRRTTLLAVTRKNYRLRIQELEPWQFAFLQACAESVSIQEAAKMAAEISGIAMEAILARLFVWLPLAMDNGYLGQPASRSSTTY